LGTDRGGSGWWGYEIERRASKREGSLEKDKTCDEEGIEYGQRIESVIEKQEKRE
jgi:hypothetical protein